MASRTAASPARSTRHERQALVLDTAARLFYSRGVHEVGMDDLIRETGLGKATVYRLYPAKDALVAACLQRLAPTILAAIEATRGFPGQPDHLTMGVLRYETMPA
jgi:AcrR family transcriptional regulator